MSGRINVDQILRQIGEFGLHQKLVYVLINVLGITHGARMLIAEFMLYIPEYRCHLPDYDNDTYKIQSPHHASLVNRFVPNATGSDEEAIYDHCSLYSNGSGAGGGGTTVGCDRWVYDTSLFTNTAITQYDLVCEDSLLGSHSQTSQMVGYFTGVLFFGAIGDKFGRLIAIYASVLIYLAGGLGLAWAPSYPVFVVLRFFNGASSSGAFTAACVLSLEMVGPSKRLWVGVLIHGTFAVGGVLLDLAAFYIRDWRILSIVATSPAVIALSFWWLIPESPRWLIKNGRTQKAEKILRKIAKVNGKHFPDDLMHPEPKDWDHKENGLNHKVEDADKEANHTDSHITHRHTEAHQKDGGAGHKVVKDVKEKDGVPEGRTEGVLKDFLRMFTYRVLLIRNLVLFLNWFSVSMSYYGLSFTADQLAAGDIFTNFLLSMCMDFPANAMVILLIDRWGRRPLHTASMVVGGGACLIGVLTTMVAPDNYQWVTVVVAMIGKLGSSAGFILAYIYASELFPTTVRSAGMGVSSAMARVGSIVASYVQHGSLELGGAVGKSLPLMVFGAFSLVAGLLTLLLPETLHKDLPDTVEDGLRFGKDPKKDEHKDPDKVVDSFYLDGVEIEMEKYVPPADDTSKNGAKMETTNTDDTSNENAKNWNSEAASHTRENLGNEMDKNDTGKNVNFAFLDDEERMATNLVLKAAEENE